MNYCVFILLGFFILSTVERHYNFGCVHSILCGFSAFFATGSIFMTMMRSGAERIKLLNEDFHSRVNSSSFSTLTTGPKIYALPVFILMQFRDDTSHEYSRIALE